MAGRGKITQNEEPPSGWRPTQSVDEPVLHSPYEEPSSHWSYVEGVPSKVPFRRPASYYYRSKKVGSAQVEMYAEEERDDLPLVNRLRTDVKRWRESGYRGASPVTKDLLAWWARPDALRPLFYCQREAAETVIYLLELALPGRLSATGFRTFQVAAEDLDRLHRGERPKFDELRPNADFFPRLVDPPVDSSLLPLRRLGCKMATGSGKTALMSMIISWAFCNRGRNPGSTWFPSAVLVCAPNLTVRKRLQVLYPADPKNYYDEFELVPGKYRELLGSGKVLITNWHTLALKSEHSEGGVSYKVVDKGKETDDAFTIDRLGDLAQRLPILVLNDEGHHCWRPAPDATDAEKAKGLSAEERKALEEDAEEARIWLLGLDRINNSGLIGKGTPGILAAVDMSATPFYLGNSGYPEGSPFPWLVSDFGLVDAIECGIVKIPRLPVLDDKSKTDEVGRPDPKYFRLWRNIVDNLSTGDKGSNKRPKPEAVYREAEGALLTIAGQWKKRFDEIRAASPEDGHVPPVMIVVCDNTEIAEIFFQKISGERRVEVLGEDGKPTEKIVYEGSQIHFADLANVEGVPRRTIRIDSRLLNKLEAEGDQTKDEAALALREIIDTVGKRGGPGEFVRCVVSVSMLTEGWDANNVTHVLGVRAFGSQLLCEQVVGRGLRRMSYTPDPKTGKLAPEYVDVYGIPFSLIPFKGRPKDTDTEDPVYTHIFPVPEREAFEIGIPVVESYSYDLRSSGIRCDVDSLDGMIVEDEPQKVYLAPTRGYQDDPTAGPVEEFVTQDREEYYKNVRFQQVVFGVASRLLADLADPNADTVGDNAKRLKDLAQARHQLFPEIVRIVQEYVAKKVQFAAGVDRRELALEKYVTLLRKRLRDGILPAAASPDAPLLPITNTYRPLVSTADVDFRTTRPCVALTKSHLNHAPLLSTWEREAIDRMEDLDAVEYFTPAGRHLGFTIPYEYMEKSAAYEPDFVVHLRGGVNVVLEIKGRGGEIHAEDLVFAKNAAARKWVAAVNNSGRFGRWAYEICHDLALLRPTLEKHVATDAPVVPFRRVEPKPADRFRTCVPLISLRAAASSWSQDQANLEGPAEWAEDWIVWDTKTKFEDGMFVARVQGDSMEPLIPTGSYCLFRLPPAGSRDGRKLLVWHSGIDDPHSGGRYTVKVYRSRKVAAEDGSWRHMEIKLEPLNPKYQPIVLTPTEENEVRVIAEFVEVVG